MNIRSSRSGLLALMAVAIGTVIMHLLQRRHLNTFGATFDKAYMQASDTAEANWADIEKLAVLDLNGPIKPEHLEQIMNLKANYLWYYSEHATRGIMLRWTAMSLPLRLRLQGRDACMRSLLQFHQENRDQLLRVKADLQSAGVPDFFLRAPFQATNTNN